MRPKSGDGSARRLAFASIFFEATFSCKRKNAGGQAIAVRRQIKFEVMTEHIPRRLLNRQFPLDFPLPASHEIRHLHAHHHFAFVI